MPLCSSTLNHLDEQAEFERAVSPAANGWPGQRHPRRRRGRGPAGRLALAGRQAAAAPSRPPNRDRRRGEPGAPVPPWGG
jgi:hypothetical protein